MAIVRSFAVGNGDMFYIKHNSDNFTIIDCQLFGDHKKWLVDEIIAESSEKSITRFISTHPDEDHIEGLEYLDERINIRNFYVVTNSAIKYNPSPSFKHYCELRDSPKAFYVKKNCQRKWMNQSDDKRRTSGINVLWPDLTNPQFKEALNLAAEGESFNNISLVARYSINNGASFMWIGDLETDFMEQIRDQISLSKTTVVFAPHHGRKSGKLPDSWLDVLRPKIIVIGEAEERHLDRYTGYNKITQTKAGDITFVPDGGKLHCYASKKSYGIRDWLDDEDIQGRDFYVGTLNF